VARDARLNASDLPDGASEIFLPVALDTPQFEAELICPSGSVNALQAVLHQLISEPGFKPGRVEWF
jgi:hypothetical protein